MIPYCGLDHSSILLFVLVGRMYIGRWWLCVAELMGYLDNDPQIMHQYTSYIALIPH